MRRVIVTVFKKEEITRVSIEKRDKCLKNDAFIESWKNVLQEKLS